MTDQFPDGAAQSRYTAIEDIIADFRAGKMVIMVDDENRENEGDMMMAAEKVHANDINFMATFGRGLICLTLTRDRCSQLDLPLMVADTDERHATNFTVTIEAAEGIGTGISARDRPYDQGPSDWLGTHVIVHTNGKKSRYKVAGVDVTTEGLSIVKKEWVLERVF